MPDPQNQNQFHVTPQANGRWHVDNSTPGFETRYFTNEASAIRAARSYAKPSAGVVLVYGMDGSLRSIDEGFQSDDG